MKNKKLTVFVGTILVFVAAAGGGILYFENIRTNGTQVILRTEPVDPRSLLRGDYVILDYEIDDISANELEVISPGPEQKTVPVYTVLEVDEAGRVISATHQRPRPTSGLYLAGKVFDQGRADRVNYGIGQYFVPEGKGWTIERIGRQWGEDPDSILEVRVAIDDNGTPQILELLIDGEVVNFQEIESENPYNQ